MPRYSFPLNGIIVVFWLAAAQAQLRPHFRNDPDMVIAHVEQLVEDHGYAAMALIYDATYNY